MSLPRLYSQIPLQFALMANELQLQESGIFYRCVEDSNDAIMLTDTQGRILYVNRAFERIYQFSKIEALGGNPRILRSKYQDADFYSKMWAQILDPKIGFWKGELVNCTKSGEEVPVLLTITPFRDAEGVIWGYMSIALDMRDKKALEAQVFQQDKLASIGLLASGLAHEIGTPLGVIRGRAEILMSKLAADENRKSLEIIVGQIDRISKLISSLLNLARVSKSESTVGVGISAVVNEVIHLVGQALKKNGIEVKLNIDPTLKVKAESDRLEQVVLNLVMNAIHAIEEAINKQYRTRHCLEITAQQKSGWVALSIRDTGCGITNENLKNIFKPFFTTKEVGSGTGLGLAICRQIVATWGGELSVESREGVGSHFTVLLQQG